MRQISGRADHTAEVVCEIWGAKRSRNTNAFGAEPSFVYKVTKRELPVVRKAYIGEDEWTIEVQGFEASKLFRLSFGEPFRPLLAIDRYKSMPTLHGLRVYCFPDESAIAGVATSDKAGNAWLLSQFAFTSLLKELRLNPGEMLSVAIRSVFARFAISDPVDVKHRLTLVEKIVRFLTPGHQSFPESH
jgi:hypothetical protein